MKMLIGARDMDKFLTIKNCKPLFVERNIDYFLTFLKPPSPDDENMGYPKGWNWCIQIFSPTTFFPNREWVAKQRFLSVEQFKNLELPKEFDEYVEQYYEVVGGKIVFEKAQDYKERRNKYVGKNAMTLYIADDHDNKYPLVHQQALTLIEILSSHMNFHIDCLVAPFNVSIAEEEFNENFDPSDQYEGYLDYQLEAGENEMRRWDDETDGSWRYENDIED